MTATPRYEAHPPMFRNNPVGFVIAVVLIAAFGLGILILLYWFVMARSRKLTIADGYLLYEEGLLSKRRTETRLTSVRSVEVYQSLFQRMFGTGDVEIFTAGDSAEVTAKGFPRPYDIRDLARGDGA